MAFGLRIWVAMMLALYVAFWLQLESASSAAVTVGILALPTRGQVLQKAVYRFVASCIGVVASIAIVGLFAEARDLYVLAFALWIGCCVYGAGFLDGNRAYGAVLAGYTVAVVAVQQMDAPQSVFLAGVNRGAAIAVGIAAITLVNAAFEAPAVGEKLVDAFAAVHRHVVAFGTDTRRSGIADPVRSGHLLREIAALHADSTALSTESLGGHERAAAARNLMVALVAELLAFRALVGRPAPAEVSDASPASAMRWIDDASTAVDVPKREPKTEDDVVAQATLTHREHRAARAEGRSLDSLHDLEEARMPGVIDRTPLYRAPEAALRNGLRAALATALAALPFILGGWPASSLGYSLVGVTVALSAINPNPAAFAMGALVAMPLASACAGVTEFLILDGVDQFPLLAVGMAPTVFFGASLVMSKNPKVVGVGALLLVFFPVLLGPSNPQSYNPQTYVYGAVLSITAVILLSMLLATLLPTTDARKREWILASMRKEVLALMDGRRDRWRPDEAAFRDADRAGQLAGLQADPLAQRKHLGEALNLFDLAATLRRILPVLDARGICAETAWIDAAHMALARRDTAGLRAAADAIRRIGASSGRGDAIAGFVADLAEAADLVDRNGFAVVPVWSSR